MAWLNSQIGPRFEREIANSITIFQIPKRQGRTQAVHFKNIHKGRQT